MLRHVFKRAGPAAATAFRNGRWLRQSAVNTQRLFCTQTSDDEDNGPRRPTQQEVVSLPRHVSEYPNELLIGAALQGDSQAIRERLVREVMFVDNVHWNVASHKVDEMSDANQSGLGIIKLPYLVGIFAGFTSAWGVLPFVFDLSIAEWFNEKYVTTEHPPPEDVETWLEVGTWTWNWMEPVLGTLSFTLLALQFFRGQMVNIGWKPYTGWVVSSRADNLASLYPQYNRHVVRAFAKDDTGLGGSH